MDGGTASEQRPRAALVTHCVPEPPWSGERRRVAAIHAYLSESYNCDILLCRRDDRLPNRIRRQSRHPLAPPYASRFQPPDQEIDAAYDLIWVFELWAFSCVPRRLWSRVIWDKDTLMGASYLSGGAWSRLMARWVRAYERRALKYIQHAFLSLARDVDSIDAPRVTVLPPGFDAVRRVEHLQKCDHAHPIRLGFVGLLAHRPNLTGLMWFVRDVFPRLRESLASGVELWIAGGGLRIKDELELQLAPGVQVKGYVPDLDAFYASIDVAIAPLLYGEGAPTKVMEALGYGIPVVGTAEGLRGVSPSLRGFCFEVIGNEWEGPIRSAVAASDDLARSDWHREHTWPATLKRHVAPVLEARAQR
jgi:glycosyltransferase involved in cell wall biosynthesis